MQLVIILQVAFDIALAFCLADWIIAHLKLKQDYEDLVADAALLYSFMKKQEQVNILTDRQLKNCIEFDSKLMEMANDKR